MDAIALAAYKLAKNGIPGPPGAPGTDGLTPYIGLNGNWFIGEEDTGVKALGVDGINITITDIVESTEDGGENAVTFSNGQKITIKNGKTGEKGDPYILTNDDKTAIIEDVKKEFTNVYKYSGSVATYDDLPKGLLVGDAGVVWNVEEDGMNYAWTGEKWDTLGAVLKIDSVVIESGINPVSGAAVYTAISDAIANYDNDVMALLGEDGDGT